ncbi:MAG TPA: DUF1634 domain-containing protein [Spirochaetia bacterium]|nr:DUF1634 domain-containing protein [Spirochaetia bacterium]
MAEDRPAPTGRLDLEVVVSYILLGGVLASMALLLGGLVWHGVQCRTLWLTYELRPVNFFNFALYEFINAFHGAYRPRLVVSLGIVVLMLTPYVRVLASMLYFALVERNLKYAVFTLVVLAALSYSLFLR